MASQPTVPSDNLRPATIEASLVAMAAAQPRFAELAQDVHASPGEWMGALQRLQRQCSRDWSCIPKRDFPEASRDDLLALGLGSLRHALLSHPACAPNRRAMIHQILADPSDADPLAPVLHVLLSRPRAASEQDMLTQLQSDKPLLGLVGTLLAGLDDATFKRTTARFLDAISAHGSPFTLQSATRERDAVMHVSAKMAICNELLRTRGMPEHRRTSLFSALNRLDLPPVGVQLHRGSDMPEIRSFALR